MKIPKFSLMVGLTSALGFGDRFVGGRFVTPEQKVLRYLNAMDEEKCESRFIVQDKIKTIQLNDGGIKLKDPYGFHACCSQDDVSCGTTQKFFSYDRNRDACKPVFLRRLCPDLLEDLLAVKEYLNLFSKRDDCKSICMPPETTNAPTASTSELIWRGVAPRADDFDQIYKKIFSYIQPYNSRPGYSYGNNEMEMLADTTTTSDLGKTDVSPCHLAPDKGYARLFRKTAMWFYNAEKGDCETFLWRGAGGNNNRFVTYDMCISACQPGKEIPELNEFKQIEDVSNSARNAIVDIGGLGFELDEKKHFCLQEPPKSSCGFGNIATRFYYDKDDGKCHIYLSPNCESCDGKCNSFKTKDDCKKQCIKRRLGELGRG